MDGKKLPVDVAASTGEKKENSVKANPQCDYITYSGEITRARCHELIDLIVDFNATWKMHRATVSITEYAMYITIAMEYGRNGFGHIEHYYSYEDNGLMQAEKRLREIMEGRNGQSTRQL